MGSRVWAAMIAGVLGVSSQVHAETETVPIESRRGFETVVGGGQREKHGIEYVLQKVQENQDGYAVRLAYKYADGMVTEMCYRDSIANTCFVHVQALEEHALVVAYEDLERVLDFPVLAGSQSFEIVGVRKEALQEARAQAERGLWMRLTTQDYGAGRFIAQIVAEAWGMDEEEMGLLVMEELFGQPELIGAEEAQGLIGAPGSRSGAQGGSTVETSGGPGEHSAVESSGEGSRGRENGAATASGASIATLEDAEMSVAATGTRLDFMRWQQPSTSYMGFALEIAGYTDGESLRAGGFDLWEVAKASAKGGVEGGGLGSALGAFFGGLAGALGGPGGAAAGAKLGAQGGIVLGIMVGLVGGAGAELVEQDGQADTAHTGEAGPGERSATAAPPVTPTPPSDNPPPAPPAPPEDEEEDENGTTVYDAGGAPSAEAVVDRLRGRQKLILPLFEQVTTRYVFDAVTLLTLAHKNGEDVEYTNGDGDAGGQLHVPVNNHVIDTFGEVP